MRSATTFALIVWIISSPGVATEPDPVGQNPGLDSSNLGLQDRIARWIRPSIGDDERKLASLEAEIKRLPPLSPGNRGSSAGYHSRFYESADKTIDIVLDLGKVQSIDRVAVFSASTIFQGQPIPRYGFPKRFQIEASHQPDFASGDLLLDSTEVRPVIRPKFPVQVATPGLTARYLRLRVIEHWRRSDGRYLTALGEIMVLSGGKNVAIGSKAMGESFDSLPDWSLENLVDGQTDLGLPISSTPSFSNGFLSKSQKSPETDKWVRLKLPRATRIEEIRLIPATPFDAPSQHGHGFPRRFRVTASMTSDFASSQLIADHTENTFPNPGNNPVVFPTDGIDAKFVRLELKELWHISARNFALALSEFQIYENDRNVAREAKVTASDVFDKPPFDKVWRPDFLVDGYSSQNQLIELDQWIKGLDQREKNQQEIDEIEARVRQSVEETTNMLLIVATGLIATLVGLTTFTMIRRKRALVRQRDEMRARIARDLHDDLGSRLGGMRLITESILADGELPQSLVDDLKLVHQASRESTDAMRDIVWLLDNNESSRNKLVVHIRQLTPALLGGIRHEFTSDPVPDQPLDFDFRRQVLFAFKECVGNVAKHSRATNVHCRVGGSIKRFTFQVSDDGDGFEIDSANGGYGLKNLRDRAEALDGTVTVKSSPGKGTQVDFDVPVRIGKKT